MQIVEDLELDQKLQVEANEVFRAFGLDFREGIDFLLRQTVEKKSPIFDLEIEEIDEYDPDYQFVRETRGEETISLEKFLKL